jgi:LmbE family N-acetylglucosaminyl deacetylase
MGSSEAHNKRVAIIVAHPDDETLWAGGALLVHPEWRCSIFCLCRASDTERAIKFRQALARFGATGAMADLDDALAQTPLDDRLVKTTILQLVHDSHFDLILTHGPQGEYTRHLRHEETGQAVIDLWQAGQLHTHELWHFAYEDGGGSYLPRAAKDADIRIDLPTEIWEEKCSIIGTVYGFAEDSWEAQVTPRIESFKYVVASEDK